MFEKLFKSVEEVDAHADRCLRRTSHKSARYPHYYEFADLYYKLGAYSKALAYLKVLVENGVTSVRVLSLYGDCLSQLGRSKEDELTRERSISQPATDDCSLSEASTPMPNSIDGNDTYFDASDIDTDKKSGSFSLENSLIHAVKAVDIGDDLGNSLGGAEPNAAQLEQMGKPSCHLMLFLVYLIRNDLRRKSAQKTLSYLKRLMHQINIGERTLDARIIREAKLNLAMSFALYILASAQNLTKEKLQWCAKTIRRLRGRPEIVDRMWKPIADERYMFCSLYSIYLERHCGQDEQTCAEAVLDGEYKELTEEVDTIGDQSDASELTAQDLAGFIERNQNKIDAIVWLCYCYWLEEDGGLVPTSLNFDKLPDHWLDRYCFLFGLEHMFKQSCDHWCLREMSTAVLMPYLISSSPEYSSRYIEGWWLLSSKRLVGKTDEQKLTRLSAVLRLEDDKSSELICPSALLTMASCLLRLAKSTDDEERKMEMLGRSEKYLTTLLSGYIDTVRHLCRAKLWFACDAVPIDKRSFRYQTESELSDVLATQGDYHHAISVLSASGNRSLRRNVQLLQLLLRDPEMYRDRALKLCRRILQELRSDPGHPDYQIVSDMAKSLKTDDKDLEEDRNVKAIRPIMTTLLEMLPSIQSLQTVVMWIKDKCLPRVEAVQLQRLIMASQLNSLTKEIVTFQGSVRQQRQLFVDWHNNENNKPHELQAIEKASHAAESALEALNERMANLHLA